MAASTDGRIAVADGADEYRIRVFARDGTWRDVVRELPRPRYSASEIAEIERRRARGNALRQAEGKKAGVSGAPSAPPRLPEFKPHVYWGGLRFDPAGRLWVFTGRGGESSSVLDVFDRSLRYLGEVRIPVSSRTISFGGSFAVTSEENEDGIPTVTLWRVRAPGSP